MAEKMKDILVNFRTTTRSRLDGESPGDFQIIGNRLKLNKLTACTPEQRIRHQEGMPNQTEDFGRTRRRSLTGNTWLKHVGRQRVNIIFIWEKHLIKSFSSKNNSFTIYIYYTPHEVHIYIYITYSFSTNYLE